MVEGSVVAATWQTNLPVVIRNKLMTISYPTSRLATAIAQYSGLCGGQSDARETFGASTPRLR